MLVSILSYNYLLNTVSFLTYSFILCDINSSIGYNLSVVVDSCNTKALIDSEYYNILFVCYKGVTKRFSSRYCTSTQAVSMRILSAVVNNNVNIEWKHPIHNGSTPI